MRGRKGKEVGLLLGLKCGVGIYVDASSALTKGKSRTERTLKRKKKKKKNVLIIEKRYNPSLGLVDRSRGRIHLCGGKECLRPPISAEKKGKKRKRSRLIP